MPGMRISQIAAAFMSIAFVLGAGVEKCSAISSPVLLTIDDSNPSAVTITATGFPPGVDNTGKPVSSGVDLLGFFFANETTLFGHALPNSTLTGGNSGAAYHDLRPDNFSAGGDVFTDLILFLDNASPGANNTQTFSTLQPAFTGSWTINFSDLGVGAPALPTPGTTGDILSGFSGDQGAIIGQWEVAAVPEPSVGSLIILASVMGLAIRSRRVA
jgi:hypothetical protein